MKSLRSVLPLFSILLLSTFFFLQSAVLAAQGQQNKPPERVAFLPFSVHAAPELSYLGAGIRNMLASRLAAGAGIVVVDQGLVSTVLQDRSLTASMMQDVLRDLEADYLVTGSLTALAGRISLDAEVHGRAAAVPLHFSVQAEEESQVIGSIDQLAWEIAAETFGVQKPPSRAASLPGIQAPTQPDSLPATPFRTAHPEKAFLDPDGEARRLHGETAGTGGSRLTGGLHRSSDFKFGLRAFAVGDLTGDGSEELVLASRTSVQIYRLKGGSLEEIANLPVPASFRAHWVSLADLDGNGRKELFISAASVREPHSLAYAWEGGQFVPLFQGAPWYIRALELPGEGPVLLGQRQGKDQVLQPGIQRLRPVEGALREEGPQSLPDFLTIFDFTMADITGDGHHEIIHLDQEDRLMVCRTDGTILWRSGEAFGGSKRILGGEDNAQADQGFYQPGYVAAPRYYLPSVILAADLDGNGAAEIIINRNHPRSVMLLGNLRSYGSGEIRVLAWNGSGLAQTGHSRAVDGYIVDYGLQTGKEGERRLLVGVELDGGGPLSNVANRKSTILTFGMD